jgi:hypothetical protein
LAKETAPGWGAVQVERLLVLAGQVDELRGAGLHAVGHLVGGDAGGDLRVAGVGQSDGVEVLEDVEGLPLPFGRDALRVAEVEDGLAGGAEGDPLVGGGEEAAGPESGTAARAARPGLQHHEAGQVLRLAADAVGDPGAHARPAELR